jgi:capsular exopolysaccharide synthesis family protein
MSYPLLHGQDPTFRGAAADVGADEESVRTMRDYWHAILRRKWLVLFIAALATALAAWRAYSTERSFASVAVVQINQQTAAPSGGLAGLAASLGGGGDLNSQVETIHSRMILGQVVDSLGLRLQRLVPDFIRPRFHPSGIIDEVSVPAELEQDTLHLGFGEATVRVSTSRTATPVELPYGAPVSVDGIRFVVPSRPGIDELTLYVVPRDVAVDELVQAVRPNARSGTGDMIDVVVVGYDPAITRRIANATANVFHEYTSRKARESAVKRRDWVLSQMDATGASLKEVQDSLTVYRQREQLYSSKAKLLAGQSAGVDVEADLAQLTAERQVYQQLLDRLTRSGRVDEGLSAILSSPTTGTDPVLKGLFERVAQYQGQRDSLTIGPGSKALTDPDVRKMDSLIVKVQRQMIVATRSHVESVNARIEAYTGLLAKNDVSMQKLAAAEPEEQRLLMQVEAFGEALKQLREKYYTVGAAEAMGDEPVTLMDEALPGSLSGTGPIRAMIFGLIFGLMAGSGGAIALDAANRAIRRREDVEELLHLNGLGVIPALAPAGQSRGTRLLARGRAATPFLPRRSEAGVLVSDLPIYSPVAEAYRTLRTNLLCSPAGPGLRSLVVTSPSGGEGKTTIAANLAITMAQQGMRVLLVDGDLRRAQIHKLFGLEREPGLTEVLLGEIPLSGAVRATSTAGLSILSAGGLPKVSPSDLLASPALRTLVETAAGEYDLVMFDTPPLLALSDAALIGRLTDGVLLVIRAGQTDRDEARTAVRQVRAVGVPVVGAVLNDPAELVVYPRRYYEVLEPTAVG